MARAGERLRADGGDSPPGKGGKYFAAPTYPPPIVPLVHHISQICDLFTAEIPAALSRRYQEVDTLPHSSSIGVVSDRFYSLE